MKRDELAEPDHGRESTTPFSTSNPAGAPLRAWIRDLAPADGRIAALSPTALDMLALGEGDAAEIRAVHGGMRETAQPISTCSPCHSRLAGAEGGRP